MRQHPTDPSVASTRLTVVVLLLVAGLLTGLVFGLPRARAVDPVGSLPAGVPGTPITKQANIVLQTNTQTTGYKALYVVPADKWLAISNLEVQGVGRNRFLGAGVIGYGNTFHLQIPNTTTVHGTKYWFSGLVDFAKLQWIPPGTSLEANAKTSGPATAGDNPNYNVTVYMNGYLVPAP